jgi:hypothetical protein
LTRHALKTFFRRYTKGLVEYRTKSDFLMRHQPENKVRFEARLGWASREMLRRLAYSFRISQAELLRIALEYYIYCFGPQAP